jgi:hypothetical protein
MVVNRNGIGCSAFRLLFIAIIFVSVLSITTYACHDFCRSDDDCNDCNVCTIDECVDKRCVYTNVEDGTVCDDYDPETINDVCMAGMCQGYPDEDGDGYDETEDCDDSNPDVYPGALEVCDDEIDNDCDGLIDNEDEDCYECFADEDCDDSNSCTADVCVCGQCEYTDLEDGTECDDGDSNTINDVCCSGFCYGETDDDGDGYGDDDCDDSNPDVNPGATEICTDGIDNDCDGLIDCDDDSCSSDPACAPQPPKGGPTGTGWVTTTLSVCGDEECEFFEDCSNCPEDCLGEGEVCCDEEVISGNCCVDDDCGSGYTCTANTCEQVTGGVVTEPECVKEWICDDWSECVDGTQTRICVDIKDCGTVEEIPELEQECEVESPITGLFTFITSPTGYASMLILGLFLLMLFLSMRKK